MCADTHWKRRLMGVLKCCSEWCRNFSYLRISVRSVFQKWEKYSSNSCCLPSHFQPLCYSHSLSGEIYSNKKFLSFLLIKFCFRKTNPSSAKLKIHVLVIVFPSFSEINSKATFRRKAINKKSSFAFFQRKVSICTRLLTTTCSRCTFQVRIKSTRWTSSSRSSVRQLCKMKHALWKSPQWRRCHSDEDVCLCRERGLSLLSDRYSDHSRMNGRNWGSTATQHGSLSHYSSEGWYVFFS